VSDNRLVYRNPEKKKSTLKKEQLSSEAFIHPLANRLVAVLNSPGFPSLSIMEVQEFRRTKTTDLLYLCLNSTP